MDTIQAGILDHVPRLARYLSFTLKPGVSAKESLQALSQQLDGDKVVVGLGKSLVLAMGIELPGLKDFPANSVAGIEVPSTPAALWCWIRGGDPGDHVHETHHIEQLLEAAFDCVDVIDAFQHGDSRDLTGYEDGTENPQGDDAIQAAIIQGQGNGLDGSSFVAIQQWVHDLDSFNDMSQPQQDHCIGRRKSDNEELDDAPDSAHVKRTAQEDFEPEAFVLRRSMPWSDSGNEGLVFVAFGRSFDAFEAQLRRMLGMDDGITDALFDFTRPVTGNYYWCPPVANGKLDLSALNL